MRPADGPDSDPKLYRDVADHLHKQIVRGDYRLGERLPSQRILMSRFAVSRQTIREAIVALEVRGFVEVHAASGVYVTDPEKSPFQLKPTTTAFELLEARRAIEGEAAALATMHIARPELDRLDSLTDRLTLRTTGRTEASALEGQWLHILSRCTRNRALEAMVDAGWDAWTMSGEVVRLLGGWERGAHLPSLEGYRMIAQALRSRDPVGARAAVHARHATLLDQLLASAEEEALNRARDYMVSARARYSPLNGARRPGPREADPVDDQILARS